MMALVSVSMSYEDDFELRIEDGVASSVLVGESCNVTYTFNIDDVYFESSGFFYNNDLSEEGAALWDEFIIMITEADLSMEALLYHAQRNRNTMLELIDLVFEKPHAAIA
jgi:hypothetical protein